ncbi:MAG: heme exporter protein CcmB [Acidobacteria bacterium]|nr:heme exporter protein CcmB [Acidobacteriota bacterium]
MTRLLRQAWTIAAKDLRTELRNKESISAALSFTLVVILLFSFAFDPVGNPDVREQAGGLLWIIYLFSGILLLNRTFSREAANDCLEALVASPMSGAALFLGKAVSSCLLLLVLELASLPLFGVFYAVTWTNDFGMLLLVLVLGSWGFTVIGTLFSAVTANNRLRELMLPLLVFPMTLPALLACVELTSLILLGEPLGDSVAWLKLLFGFDVIFTLLGAVLLEVVLLA